MFLFYFCEIAGGQSTVLYFVLVISLCKITRHLLSDVFTTRNEEDVDADDEEV